MSDQRWRNCTAGERLGTDVLASQPGHGGARRGASADGAGSQLRHRRTARDGRARDWAPRRHDSSSRHTTRRRPNRCAAHPEPFSSVDVDLWEIIWGSDPFFVDVYVRRGTAERDVGVRRRVSDKRPWEQPPAIGASSEGRLAWPHVPSVSGHLCKAPRPQNPRVALRRAPVRGPRPRLTS